ncbi:hypothetical protein SOCEGT47_038980 [Sorangium cellulosum]|uniref:Uncharacterized protein n=1 Tax=Sorangium cellulosum TaxID=56 RepID=A0A4P2Q3A9_SORCE|nr:hypothetical protein [Sorangium cellulosum]AUX23373.1 hypothetical protein SOCEGT47_038980 [Sorangium cellulosum]
MSGARRRRASVVLALAAALAYGSWAVFCNWGHGASAAVRAGGAQAVLSFSSTFAMARIADWLFRLGRTPVQGLILGIVCAVLLMFGLMYGVHATMGTRSILATIAPSLLVGSVFITLYVFTAYASATRGAEIEGGA